MDTLIIDSQLQNVINGSQSSKIVSENFYHGFGECKLSEYIGCIPTELKPKVVELLTYAIDKLPEESKVVLSLHIIEELHCHEIAEVLNTPETKVLQLYRKSMSTLYHTLRSHLEHTKS